MDYTFSVVIVLILSLAASIALTRLAQVLSWRWGFIAAPGGRRKHGDDMPKFGALPLWGAFTLTVLIAQLLPVERADPNEIVRLTGLLLGGTFIFLFGIADDKFDLPALPQFAAQFLTAGIGIAFLIFIERFNNPLTGELTAPWPHLVTIVISLFWLVLMMNTVNFLDGVDGLAGGVNFIAALLLFIHTYREGQLSVSLLPLALMGTTLGFLFFNWHPARIFMGSGAVYLGYIIGALSIIGGAKMATILLVMGLPLLDLAWQFARRLAVGKNPFVGDRGHIHYRLLDAGVSPRVMVLGYYAYCAAFGVLALMTTSRSFKFIGLLVMIGLTFVGFAIVARRSVRRKQQITTK